MPGFDGTGPLGRAIKANPDKQFHPVSTCCKGMKQIGLEKIVASLEEMEFKVNAAKDSRVKAKRALERMLIST